MTSCDSNQTHDLALLINTISEDHERATYRIPNTHTTLNIALLNIPIEPYNLGRMLHETQKDLRQFIDLHNANDTLLATRDDPYESSRRWTGAFVGVTAFPHGYQHLTYGILMEVLQGLWTYCFIQKRHQVALFQVMDDQFGVIGIGRLLPRNPEDGGIHAVGAVS